MSAPVPARRLCILGDGQLGRMLTLAALPLGVRTKLVSTGGEPRTSPFAGRLEVNVESEEGLAELADVQVFTVESENVEGTVLARLGGIAPVRPSPAAILDAQDRVREKRRLEASGIPVAPWRPVDSPEDLEAAMAELGLPVIVKTRRFGFDGRGQHRIHAPEDARVLPEELWAHGLVAERMVRFGRELSLLCARGVDGTFRTWPLVENVHRHGILVRTVAPAGGLSDGVEARLREQVGALLAASDYVGTFALEVFETAEGLLANEMAPRVHNSGHWTMDGAETCQFENHVRAVTGLPLGGCRLLRSTVMFNLIGRLPDIGALLALPGVHVHLYDKTPRPGRKVGHVNVCEVAGADFAEVCAAVEGLVEPSLDFGALAG